MVEKYIIRKSEIDALAGTEKVHFLNDNAKRNNKSLGDLTNLKAIGFHMIEVPPGCDSTEEHRHLYEEECVYILEGEAQSRISTEITTVGAGDFIGYRAGGEAHTLTNTGADVLRCIVVGQRLDHDVGEYPDQNKRLFRNAGLPWNMVDIADVAYPEGGKK